MLVSSLFLQGKRKKETDASILIGDDVVRQKKDQDADQTPGEVGQMINPVNPWRLFFHAMFSPCLRCRCCLRRSRNERLFEKGKKMLREEINIVEFLKRFRECQAFLKSCDQGDNNSVVFAKSTLMPILMTDEYDSGSKVDAFSKDDSQVVPKAPGDDIQKSDHTAQVPCQSCSRPTTTPAP